MEQDTDPKPDLNADLDPEVRAAARQWARQALADARARRTPERLNAMRALVGLPPTEHA